MSSSTASGYGDLSKINFTGGFPDSKDLAPSIVFLVLYALTVPIIAWRLIHPVHRTVVLIRPALFLGARIAMLVLRAIMSKSDFGEGELIGELILVSIGYLFLIEPMIEMWRRSVATAVTMDQAPRWVVRLSWILKYALLAAIATAIAGSSQIGSALNDPSKLKTVIDLRKASAILAFAVSVIAPCATIATHFRFGHDARRTTYLIPLMLCLVIVSVYKLIQTFSTDPNSGIRSRAAFWIMQMVFEFLAYAGLLAISIPTWFPNPKHAERREQDVEMARTTKDTVPVGRN